ncbi:MAG TPA: hypothetical protein VFG92_00910 [Agromyces sp.]|nr:hypothetical protein [Agromyces sp.]
MSDDGLIVSGGGSTAVAVDELFVDASRLGATESMLRDWIERLGVIQRGIDGVGLVDPMASWGTASPMWVVRSAANCLDLAVDQARELRVSLIVAAERYGATERMIDGLWRIGASMAAPVLGIVLMSPLVMGGMLLAAGGQFVGSKVWELNGLGPTPLARWLSENRGLLSDPAFGRMVGLAVDHADEFLAGALHVPLSGPVISAIGADIGAPENAAAIAAIAGVLGLAGSKVLVDGPVKVERSAERVVAPPSGYGDLADRVPPAEADAAQIRIERYGEGDDRRYIVYIGGTVEFGMAAGPQPFDMTNNLLGIADDSSLDELRWAGAESGAGERAVREAMREQGVQPHDPVVAIGHSGGGIIAANLAADPELNVVGAVNLGGPVSSAPTRDGVPLLSLEHVEDLVPMTGGTGHPSDELVRVSRSVLDSDRQYDTLVPAHELSRYRETAVLLDASEEEHITAMRELVSEITRGDSGERVDWTATRDLSRETRDVSRETTTDAR